MFRQEKDGLGPVKIRSTALYGAHTQRAVENFPITGIPISHYPEIVRSMAIVKKACARANADLGALQPDKADLIIEACQEIIGGKHHEQFVVDVIQGGAGTSTNMNANEVIANLALRKMGLEPGDYQHLHPNDDVNRSQSTNDVYPTAIRLAALAFSERLTEVMRYLCGTFQEKAKEFCDVAKIGRTQLQDAVPMTLGAEFAAFAHTIAEDVERVGDSANLLREVNLGGTAIGTMINTPEGYREKVMEYLVQYSGMDLYPARDLIEATSDLGAFVMFSGTLKRISVKLSKICNDLRLLSSGPRAGIGEIKLPAVQAGSSIMPGKVNPVIPEMVNQVCFQAIGNDLVVTMAAESGQLQLNAMEPVIIYKILETATTLTIAIRQLGELCVSGIEADQSRCASLLENSLAIATSLTPVIGYEKAAELAKLAQARGTSIVAIAEEFGLLEDINIKKLLWRGPKDRGSGPFKETVP